MNVQLTQHHVRRWLDQSSVRVLRASLLATASGPGIRFSDCYESVVKEQINTSIFNALATCLTLLNLKAITPDREAFFSESILGKNLETFNYAPLRKDGEAWLHDLS